MFETLVASTCSHVAETFCLTVRLTDSKQVVTQYGQTDRMDRVYQSKDECVKHFFNLLLCIRNILSDCLTHGQTVNSQTGRQTEGFAYSMYESSDCFKQLFKLLLYNRCVLSDCLTDRHQSHWQTGIMFCRYESNDKHFKKCFHCFYIESTYQKHFVCVTI